MAYAGNIFATEEAEVGATFAVHHAALTQALPCLNLAFRALLPEYASHLLLAAQHNVRWYIAYNMIFTVRCTA